MRTASWLILLLLCSTAEATNDGPKSEPGNVDVDVSGVSSSYSKLRSEVDVDNSNSLVSNVESQGGEATSTIESGAVVTEGGSGGAGGNVSTGPITIEAPEQRGTVKIKNTPTAVPADIYPTGPCFKGDSAALSLPGFGIGGGRTKLDPGCVEREEIRLAAQMGMIDRAVYRWCSLSNNVASFGSREKCLEFEPEKEDLIPPTSDDLPPKIEDQVFEVASGPQIAQISEADQAKIDRVIEINDEMEELLEEIARLKAAEKERKEARKRQEEAIEKYKVKWGEGMI